MAGIAGLQGNAAVAIFLEGEGRDRAGVGAARAGQRMGRRLQAARRHPSQGAVAGRKGGGSERGMSVTVRHVGSPAVAVMVIYVLTYI
ncbi:hypothetical protein HALA3H3_p20055 [Halomonas sp. A3H3]|nr:hypothetical protein HALA3H3_p20055 [Halomonas sp. A3H3]